MQFTTNFPGGNGRLLRGEEKDWGWEIEFLAETKAREPMPLWFYFRLDGLSGEKVRLRLANSGQCLGDPAAWGKNKPVFRCTGDWQRVPAVENRLVRHNIWETCFEIPLTGDSLEFAFFYPYTQARMDRLSEALGDVFETDVIGYSAMGRPILRYVNKADHFHADRPSVYVIARQHAGEATGTFEIEGMMRYLASEAGQSALNAVNWWFVPFVDVDGVEEGFYGKDQIYTDLNRAWAPWFARRTELIAVEHDLYHAKDNANLVLLLDLHAPGHDERDSYFVTSLDDDPARHEELRRIRDGMAAHMEKMGYETIGFLEKKAVGNTSSQSGWTAAEFARSLGVNGCSIECTYQGERCGRDYEVSDYLKIGECLARGVAEALGNRQ